MNKRQKLKMKRKENKRLVETYPFLLPRNVWTGKPLSNYNYNYTLLDDMPNGWKKAFGEEFCKDLKAELIKADYLDKYFVTQVKEKFGTLRWYDNGNSEGGHIVINNYEHLSAHTCINCGKIDVPILDDGYICPECEQCYNRRVQHAKKRGYNLPAYKDVISDDSALKPTYKVTRFSKEGEIVTEYDISDILRRVRKEK